MTAKEMFDMRQRGATYQQIADAAGVTRQWAHEAVTAHVKRILSSKRGKGFHLDDIVYKGVYDHFKENKNERLVSFCKKVCGSTHTGGKTQILRKFLIGETDTKFTIDQIKSICDVIGKPFEEVFKERGNYV